MLARALVIVATAVLVASPAGAMSVADFLAKADALKAKGMMALFSSDFRLLKTDATDGFKVWAAQIAPPGRPPNACPPSGGLEMSTADILALLKAVPPAQRATTRTADAFVAGLNRRYPCHS
jgi:hypothetical protein